MASRYTANNDNSAEVAYKLRSVYRLLSYPSDAPEPIDMLYGNSLYGKIDRNMNACYLDISDGGSIIHFENVIGVFAVNFVVRAFHKFRESFIELVVSGATSQIPAISGLEPVLAWTDFDNRRVTYLNNLKTYMVTNFLKSHSRDILNFDDFVRVFLKHMCEGGIRFPVTRTAIMLSSTIPATASGLIIDLADEDSGSDETKESMLASPSFSIYATKAAQHGFLIDKNSPWRLVANLASPSMQEHMRRSGVRYRPGSASDYFEEFCMQTHLHDMDDLREFMLGTYNEFASSFPFRKMTSVCRGKTISSISQRNFVSRSNPRYDEEYWLRLLLRVRIEETNLTQPFTKHEFNKIIEKSLMAFRFYGLEKSLNIINSAIKARNKSLFSFSEFFLDSAPKNEVESLDEVTTITAFKRGQRRQARGRRHISSRYT